MVSRTKHSPSRSSSAHRCLLFFLLFAYETRAQDVTGFTLIDADTDLPIAAHSPLVDGAVLELPSLPPRLNVRAEIAGAVGSVGFELSGAESHEAVESVAPYALFGDNNGDYNPWSPALGSYTLVARSFTETGGGGTAGTDFEIGFTVADGAQLPPDGDGGVAIEGGEPGEGLAARRWHRLTLALSGPGASETSAPNPFLDRRFNWLSGGIETRSRFLGSIAFKGE